MAKVLIVEDEPSILSVLSTLLRSEGYDVQPMPGGDKAQELLKSESFNLMISDIRMTPVDGMELLKFARKTCPNMAVIMITAYGSVETAVDAMKEGAFDYVTKPFKVDELLLTVQRALEYSNAMAENVMLKAQLNDRFKFENIVAESPAMIKVCEMIEHVAPTDTTVLIQGESGTGKELVAKAIHAHSIRSGKSFIPINCAALPEPLLESELFGHVKGAFTGASSNKEGLFEVADGGTIFLDEIGTMPINLQSKLLRTLQEREVRKVGGTKQINVDVRVLAATNERIEDQIKEGKFREDLFYRLSVIPIEIPPLRSRPEDILPLVYHILARELGDGTLRPEIDKEAQLAFQRYAWPGNVRELENAVRHACTFANDGRITMDVLPPQILKGGMIDLPVHSQPAVDEYKGQSLKAFLRAKEKDYLQTVLEHVEGDKVRAAETLKISLATLYRKLPEPVE